MPKLTPQEIKHRLRVYKHLLAACQNASQELHRWPDMQGPMLHMLDDAIRLAEEEPNDQN